MVSTIFYNRLNISSPPQHPYQREQRNEIPSSFWHPELTVDCGAPPFPHQAPIIEQIFSQLQVSDTSFIGDSAGPPGAYNRGRTYHPLLLVNG